jgi:hypothetical protein
MRRSDCADIETTQLIQMFLDQLVFLSIEGYEDLDVIGDAGKRGQMVSCVLGYLPACMRALWKDG